MSMFPTWCKIVQLLWRTMTPQPIGLQQSIRFGEDFELDLRPRRLRRNDRVLKLERIPLEILILLLERRGEIVSRDEIVARIWGNDVFLDTDNSIRGAIRKVRQVLKDDPETPRFIQTVTGRGYRCIAPVGSPTGARSGPEAAETSGSTNGRDFVEQLDGWLEARKLRVVEKDRSREEPAQAEGLRRADVPRFRIWFFTGLGLFAIVCLAVLIWGWQRFSRPPIRAEHKTVLAVLPFEHV